MHVKKPQLSKAENVVLTYLAGGSLPPLRTDTVKLSPLSLLTAAVVEARGGGARVVHHLAVGAGESLRTRAHVLVGGRVLTRAAVQTRAVRAAVVEI